jgi:hypothetical protein
VCANTDEFPDYWTRLNYGVIAVKQKSVCLIDDYVVHSVRIPLPAPVQLNVSSEEIGGPCDALCNRLRIVVNTTRGLVASMQTAITQLIQRVYTLVPDISEAPLGRARQSRALFALGGKIAHYIFGVATDSSVDEMRKAIADLQLVAQTSLGDAAKTRAAMADYTHIANQRLDSMHAILSEQQKSVSFVASKVRQMAESQFAWANTLTYGLSELSRFVEVHDTVAHLENAVQLLVASQLTPALIPVADVERILANVSRTLGGYGLRLCATTAKDIYESRSFQYARHRDSLYIRLFLPYTRFPTMAVYRTHTLSLPVAGSQELTTEIKNFPQWILQDAKATFLAHLLQPTTLPVVEQSNVILHHRRRTSCLAAIKNDDTDAIQQSCEFSTRRAIIEPIFIKLNASAYILHNLSNPQIACKWTTNKPVSTQPCVPCVTIIGCSCVLNSVEVRIVGPIDCNKTPSTTSTLHSAYNAAVLREFYDLANQTLQGDHLVAPQNLTPLQPLDVPFFSKNISQLLAADASLSYSLSKISASLTNSSSVIHSPTEAILFQYLHQIAKADAVFPNFNSIETWFILGPIPCIVLLLVLTFILHRRVQILTAVISASATRAQAFDLRTLTPTPVVITTPSPLLQWIETFRQHDFVFICMITCVIISIIALTFAVHRALSRRSFLYIDISTATHIIQLKLFCLPDASRSYSVKLPRAMHTVSISLLFSVWGYCIHNRTLVIVTFTDPKAD